MTANKKTTSGPLKHLECLFTWDINIDDITDLESIPKKLLERIKGCPRRCHATYYNILAFVSHLHGKSNTALENLAKAEVVLREEKQDEADFLVTYSSFAWLYHHLGKLEDMEAYLGKVKSIGEGRDMAVEGEKGWSFIRLGAEFYQRAKECFERALEGKPDSVSYNAGYAIVLSWLQSNIIEDDEMKPEGSLVTKQLQRAWNLDPTDNEIMLLLALQLQDSNPLQSRELIYKAIIKCADIYELNKYSYTYFKKEGPSEESFKLLEKIKEGLPNSFFPYERMGLWHWNNMDKLQKSDWLTRNSSEVKYALTEAICFFTKAVDLEPSNKYTLGLLAAAYGSNNQLEQAEGIFTRLLSDDSMHDAERQSIHQKYGGFLMFKKSEIAKAVEQLKNAYRIKIKSNIRIVARKRLLQITTWNINTKMCDNILAFLSAEDDQDRQLTADATVNGLGVDFNTKMKV